MSVFDQVYARKNTNSLKWDRLKEVYQIEDDTDLLPMWVADMDFAPPQALIDAMQKRLEHPIFGYSLMSQNSKQATVDWFKRRHNWTIEPSSILFQSGVLPAIASIVDCLTKTTDKIVVCTPIYPPFFNMPQKQDRELVFCPLIEEDGIYRFDFDALEKAFQEVSMFILCNPHNPGGMTWSQADLERIVALAIKHDVLILSDEIHADLLIGDSKHTPILTVARADEAKIVTCIAPTKTFNIAGLQVAMMVAPDAHIRQQLVRYGFGHGHFELNMFASVALEAVYTEGDAWLDALRDYLSRNMDYVISELTQIPGIRIRKPQATYLMWIDYRETGLAEKDIMQRLLDAKLALDPGTKYSEQGRGFLRFNVAAPLSTIEEAVKRFKQALK